MTKFESSDIIYISVIVILSSKGVNDVIEELAIDKKSQNNLVNPEKPHVCSYNYSSFSQLSGMKASIWHQTLIIEEGQDSISFSLSQTWMNRETFIDFGTVRGAFYFSINNKRVGICDERSLTEFKISKFVQYNQENLIKIEPIKSPQFDCIRISSESKLCIKDYYPSCRMDDNYEDAYFKLDIEVNNDTSDDQAMQAIVHLSENIKNLEESYLADCKLVAHKGKSTKVTIEALIHNPKKWTAETPNLYYGAIVLKNPTGQVISIKKFTYGFRCIEIHDAKLLINGKPLLLKGINCNDFELVGKCNEKEYEEMFKQLKRCNYNAVKMMAIGHPYFIQLCNQYGMYIMDELPCALEDKRDCDFDILTQMIVKDRNQPSVIAWSLGNHQSFGDHYLELKKKGLALDVTRPFHYEGDLELLVSDFLSRSDEVIDFIDQIGNDQEKYRKPAMLSKLGQTDNLHSIQHYIMRLNQYDNWCGGFIYNQSIQTILGNKCNALMIKKAFETVVIKEVDLSENKVIVFNNNYFKDLEGYYLKWELLEDGEVLKKGTLAGTNIEPMQSEEFVLPIGVYQQIEAAEYHLNIHVCLSEANFFFDQDEIIGWTQFKMPYEVIIKAKKMIQKALTVYDRRIKVEIIGDDFSFRISKLTGDITSLIFEDKEYLLAPLKLNLDRPRRSFFSMLSRKKTYTDYKVQDVSIENLKTEVIIKILRKVKNVKNFIITEYTIDGNGNLFVEHQLTPKKNLYKFGSTMAISNEFNKISWFGKGFDENYIEQQTGEKIGVYSCHINEYLQNFLEPQENNKTEIRWFSATTEDGEGLFFEDVDKSLLNMSALPYTFMQSDDVITTRMKDTITLHIDYNEKGYEEAYSSSQRKEQLQKNVEYQYRYKISRAF